jgi:type II secretory pathway predicted ATPase ExeA
MEHLRHFGLDQDPFRNEPLLALFQELGEHRDALRRLERGVRQAKGLSLLVGEVGSGKTMIVRRLFESLEEEIFEAGMLVVVNDAAEPSWLLRRLAQQLGMSDLPAERDALFAGIYERLAAVREEGRHAVLVIDDAQSLAHPAALAEISALLKLEYEERRLLSLVLSGTPALQSAVAAHPGLARRVDVIARLAALSREASQRYVAGRLAHARGAEKLFSAGAYDCLFALSGGLPRLINTLADNALFEAFLCGRAQVDAVDVERSHADLQLEPRPERRSQPGALSELWPAGVAPEATLPRVASVAPALEAPKLIASDVERAALDSELDAVFEPTLASDRSLPLAALADAFPSEGPPKEDIADSEGELQDLLAEFLDD